MERIEEPVKSVKLTEKKRYVSLCKLLILHASNKLNRAANVKTFRVIVFTNSGSETGISSLIGVCLVAK